MWNWTENQIELYLIRHGMTLGNVEHRYIGRQTDEPLSEDGRQQLEKRKDQWAQVCRTWDMPYVFVSPMLRCRQTAEILFPQIPQIEIDPWREMDFGEFEGRNYAQLNGDPRYQAWIDSGGTLAFPGGESREAFIARCVDGMELVMEQIRQQLAYRACPKCRETEDNGMIQEPLPVAAVVHGGTIMALLSHYCRGDYFSYQVKNAEGYHLRLSLQENKMELKEKV